MKTLHVMSLDFEYKAAFKGYESVVISREWNGIGRLDLVLNSDITNTGLIQEDDILWFDNEYHKAFIVEKMEQSLDGNSTKINITASHINTLIRDFITIPSTGQDYDVRTGTREAVVRAWVNQNAINPTDAGRAQYPIVLGPYGTIGSTITEQTRLKNLAEEISRVLSSEGLGWGLEIDGPNHRFIFNVLEGVDRTNSVLFGLKYGNMASYRKIKDSIASRNIIYVGGQGEGALREIIAVDGADGGRRKETFIDARDAETTQELSERGFQALSESVSVDAFEFQTLNRQFIYEVNYDLGDYVTVVVDKANASAMQIRKVTEVYERDSITITPEFGKTERTIQSVFSNTSARIAKLETSEAAGGVAINDSVTALDSVWSSQKTNAMIPVLPTGDPNWIAPTFQNGWINYGGDYELAGYKKDADGYIVLRGLIKNGTINVAAFTLPVGYRPAKHEIFTTAHSASTASQIYVTSAGQVQMYSASAWSSLSGIRFRPA